MTNRVASILLYQVLTQSSEKEEKKEQKFKKRNKKNTNRVASILLCQVLSRLLRESTATQLPVSDANIFISFIYFLCKHILY